MTQMFSEDAYKFKSATPLWEIESSSNCKDKSRSSLHVEGVIPVFVILNGFLLVFSVKIRCLSDISRKFKLENVFCGTIIYTTKESIHYRTLLFNLLKYPG